MSYNMCHVMLYNICLVMLYDICYVMLYKIKYVMLCYDMKIVFHLNAIVKIPFYLLWVRNIKLQLFIKQIIKFSVEATLFI